MDFEKLKMFCKVVEEGSFQKAAESEFVSQRAVSQMMKKLEDELGLKLFDREKNKIFVTPVGRDFYIYVRNMLQKFSVNVSALRYESTTKQRLICGYFSPFDGALLREKLYGFLDKKVQLSIVHESIDHLLSDIVNGLVDLATVLDYGDPGMVVTEPDLASADVYENEMIMGVSDLNPLSKLEEFPLTEIGKLPVLYYMPEENSHYLRQAFLSTLPEECQASCAHISNIEQMQMLVSLNKAVAFYPKGLFEYVLTDREHISYLPLSGMQERSRYKIKVIYNRHSDKLSLIKKLLACFE
ncbi:LysR family transcriptional regulator [Lactobacillus delbrueckii]|uniref:LysR family transcriptional regulator n=1 Tax=Lactobacillus delbrueckii TaxID=1584 RepID=UPI000682C666|nr:LysR family transcriptional regulator [Lactobacillus delbrueckii]APG74709.1 LysR family transcriptional regulator [Lactobacillus delbrueckii subsp. sunkii]KNE74154.1 LysR family transcriptional regulator [Lactobacillus delbrueckii subsp. sunkii]GHN11890.1 LysR family transcriptional regulator [Lactobacillus delbrueckii subsp. sunkii]GHN14144.1 LysR family transcriptional regulator [Lactobacillus delbrueckii subsp. sunkii]GHN52688.1 LysR family transcriptional regulator [Lactobacillus delbru